MLDVGAHPVVLGGQEGRVEDDADCDEEIHPRTLNDVVQNGADEANGRQDALKTDVLPQAGLPLRSGSQVIDPGSSARFLVTLTTFQPPVVRFRPFRHVLVSFGGRAAAGRPARMLTLFPRNEAEVVGVRRRLRRRG